MKSAADPGFIEGAAKSPGGRQHTNLQNLHYKCMKSKAFGWPGGGRGGPVGRHLKSATGNVINCFSEVHYKCKIKTFTLYGIEISMIFCPFTKCGKSAVHEYF